jgi:hypothetical protein
MEEITGARDLSTMIERGSPLPEAVIAVVMTMVRGMHDRGLDHGDLNLGNLLVREDGAGGCEAFVIDLDKAALRDEDLPFRRRLAALLRLERSYLKCVKLAGAAPGVGERDRWFALYAANNRRLASRLARWRRLMAPLLLAHRVGWLFAR